MRRIFMLIVLLALSCPLNAAPAGEIAPLAEAGLVVDDGRQELLALNVHDGRTARTVQWAEPRIIPGTGEATLADTAGALRIGLQRVPQERSTAWRVTLRNDGAQNAWLLLRGYAAFEPDGDWHYFNANYSTLNPPRPHVRTTIAFTMPMVAAYDAGDGVGLGIEPLQIFSYIENGVLPENGRSVFYYGVKLVINPGDEETVEFVTFPFDAHWGERSAVGAWHALFPEAYTPIPDGDPRVQTRGQTGSAAFSYKPSPEAVRRSNTAVDWCYAPVKIPGDWYGTPEFWDRYNENIATEERLNEYYGTLEHWHASLKNRFNRMIEYHNVSPYFYIINWTYYRLAEEEYADAMVTDPQAQNRIANWVTNKGPDVRVYLWGNRHAEDFQQALRQIWENYPISGFGHDVAMGDVKFRGPAVAVSPGRAWDEEGEYCDVSVSIAKTGDFIHELPKKQFRAGYWANGGSHIYSIAARCDVDAYEGSRFKLAGEDETFRTMRYMMGSKALQIFAGDSRDNTTNYYDHTAVSHEAILDKYRRIGVSSMQYCLKWGVLPCGDMFTGRQETWEIGEMAHRDVYPFPWQLIPAAEASSGQVDVTRYGTGAESRLVVLNPRGVPLQTELTVYEQEVGARLVFARNDGEPTVNRLGENTSTISLELEPAGIVVLVPVADAAGLAAGTVTAQVQPHPAREPRVELRGAGQVRLLSPNPVLRVNGPAGHDLPAEGHTTLYAPVFFDGDVAALHDMFRFMETGGPVPALVVAAQAPREYILAAEALQEYVRFYTEEVLQKERLIMPITAEAPADRPLILLNQADATATEVTAGAAGRLTLAGPPEAIRDHVYNIMSLLDDAFPFYGMHTPTVHQRPVETELRRTIGIAWSTVMRDGSTRSFRASAWLFSPIAKGPAYDQPWEETQ